MGSGFSKMKKQAKALQEQFADMQEELQNMRVTGSAGNGLVEVLMNGDKEVLEIKINPDCVDKDDLEGLQDLLVATLKDANEKVKEQSPDNDLGGLGLPFGM